MGQSDSGTEGGAMADTESIKFHGSSGALVTQHVTAKGACVGEKFKAPCENKRRDRPTTRHAEGPRRSTPEEASENRVLGNSRLLSQTVA